jgi:hypothetical protein
VPVLEARPQCGDSCGLGGWQWLPTFYGVEQRHAELISCTAVATSRSNLQCPHRLIFQIYAFMVLVARELFGFDD